MHAIDVSYNELQLLAIYQHRHTELYCGKQYPLMTVSLITSITPRKSRHGHERRTSQRYACFLFSLFYNSHCTSCAASRVHRTSLTVLEFFFSFFLFVKTVALGSLNKIQHISKKKKRFNTRQNLRPLQVCNHFP